MLKDKNTQIQVLATLCFTITIAALILSFKIFLDLKKMDAELIEEKLQFKVYLNYKLFFNFIFYS
jgi:hypothetical protein